MRHACLFLFLGLSPDGGQQHPGSFFPGLRVSPSEVFMCEVLIVVVCCEFVGALLVEAVHVELGEQAVPVSRKRCISGA